METDFLGARLDLTLLERVPETFEIQIVQSSGELLPLADYTFTAVLRSQVKKEYDLSVELARKDVIAITFPELRAGTYMYELWADSDAGRRLFAAGRVGVLEVMREMNFVRTAGERRRYDLHMPRVSGQRLRAEAIASSAALAGAKLAGQEADRARQEAEKSAEHMREAENWSERAAEEARKAAEEAVKLIEIDKYIERVIEGSRDLMQEVIEEEKGKFVEQVKDVVDGTLEEAERRSDELEKKIEGIVTGSLEEVEEKKKELQDTLEQMNSLRETVEQLQHDIRASITIDEDGYLYIGGEATGTKIVGDPGKSPYMDTEGYLHYYDDNTGEWHSRLIEGKDGFSPYVNDRGFWMAVDPMTGEIVETKFRAFGTDGVSGDSVVRHLINSVDELPASGDTCNGGHYYYVPKQQGGGSSRAAGGGNIKQVDIAFEAFQLSFIHDFDIVINGVRIGYWLDETAKIEDIKQGIEATITDGSIWCEVISYGILRLFTRGDELKVTTDSLGIIYITEYPECPEEEEDSKDTNPYDVYAWLVDQREEIKTTRNIAIVDSNYCDFMFDNPSTPAAYKTIINKKEEGSKWFRIKKITMSMTSSGQLVDTNANDYLVMSIGDGEIGEFPAPINGKGYIMKNVYGMSDPTPSNVVKNTYLPYEERSHNDMNIEFVFRQPVLVSADEPFFLKLGLLKESGEYEDVVLASFNMWKLFNYWDDGTPQSPHYQQYLYYEHVGDDITYNVLGFDYDEITQFGGEGWTKVGEKNDISSTKVYGLNKLGTDLPVLDGAPVGVNDTKQMYIPLATVDIAGAVRTSTKETIRSGALIGQNEQGQLVGAPASLFDLGGVRISTNEVCEAEIIGYTVGGALGVMFGGVGQPGVFAVTCESTETDAAIGADGNHNLRLNLDPSSPIYWDEERKYVSLRVGEGISTDGRTLSVGNADQGVYGLVKLDNELTDRDAVPTVGVILEQLKYYAKASKAITVDNFNEKLGEALQGGAFEFVKPDDLKDFITLEYATEHFMAKKGYTVMAFESKSDMPALEDQEKDIIYIHG